MYISVLYTMYVYFLPIMIYLYIFCILFTKKTILFFNTYEM